MTEKQRQELCERFSQIFAVANPDPNVPFEKFIYDAMLKAFIAGAEYAWNNPNWISVEDELPKHDTNENGLVSFPIVLVCLYDGYRDTSYYDDIGEEWEDYDGEVEYWMPIPAPPKKGGEK